jgi:hypothetical protein
MVVAVMAPLLPACPIAVTVSPAVSALTEDLADFVTAVDEVVVTVTSLPVDVFKTTESPLTDTTVPEVTPPPAVPPVPVPAEPPPSVAPPAPPRNPLACDEDALDVAVCWPMRTPPKVPTPMATTSASTGVTQPSGRFFFTPATSFRGVPAGSWLRALDIVFSFLVMLRMD